MPPSGSYSENYMLITSGLSDKAPFLAGWQEFKDHLRKIVEHQPGWTEVKAGPGRGEMQGWCRLERKPDAEATYGHYTAYPEILVHLFKTSRTNGDYRLLKCNCSGHFEDLKERDHSPRRSGIDAPGVNQYVSRVSRAPVPQYIPTQNMYSYSAYPQASAYTTTPTYMMPAAPMQTLPPQYMYSTTGGGIPVNTGGGAMMTEARGIFISNLNYKVEPQDLVSLLQTVAQPVESKLHSDSRTGVFKGSATAKFATKEEAQYAVSRLNKTQHMGMTIKVRLDTDRTVVGQVQAGPVIANGSHNYWRG